MRDHEKAFYKSLLGSVIDRKYKLTSLIGQGGMAMVFLAERLHLRDMVAVKVLRPRQDSSEDLIGRFQVEAAAAAKVKHPNVVTIYDFGYTDEGVVYIVMELLEGPGLDMEMRRLKRIPIERTLEILKPVCSAIGAAHSIGLLHRDIKPSNIILHRNRYENAEVAKVVDFGIAKFYESPDFVVRTSEGVVLGTAEYMSPEQCQGQPLNGRSDIYSLAMVCYQMLSGSLAYNARNTNEYLIKHVRSAPIPLRDQNSDIPPQIEQVVMRALSKDPMLRPSTAPEFYEQLEKAWLEAQARKQAIESGIPEQKQIEESTSTAYLEPHFEAFGGRSSELARMLEAWREACKSEPRPLLLLGEPGIGKSSLLTEFCNQIASTGAVVLRSRYYESTGIRSYHGLIIELKSHLRRLRTNRERFLEIFGTQADLLMQEVAQIWQTGGLASYSAAQEVRDRNFVTLAKAFSMLARHKPVLLAVDDLHWSDESAHELLGHFAHTLGNERLLIVASARISNVRESFKSWLNSFGRNCNILQLKRMQKPQIVEMLEAIFGRIGMSERQFNTLRSTSGGNPFFLIELIKALVAEKRVVLDGQRWVFGDLKISLPRTIVDYVELALEKMPQETRQILAHASVVGEQFDLELLSHLLQNSDALDESIQKAMRSGIDASLIIQLPEDVYRFSSTAVRSIFYDSLNKRARRRIHKAVAEWLSIHRPTVHDLAYHYYESMQPEQAFVYCLKAAEKACERFQVDELRRYTKWAEQCIEESDLLSELDDKSKLENDEDTPVDIESMARFRWLHGLGLLYRGRSDLAEEHLQKALRQAVSAPEMLGEIYLTLGLSRFGAGSAAGAMDYYRRAIDVFRVCGNLIGQAKTLQNMCILYEQRGDYTLALDCARGALQLASLASSSDMEVFALSSETWILARLRRFEEAELIGKKALAIARKSADQAACCSCNNALAELYVEQGDYEQALGLCREALRIARLLGNTRYEFIITTNLGEVLFNLQKYAEAESYYLKALKLLEQGGNRLFEHSVLNRLVRTSLRMDKLSQAQAYMTRAETLAIDIDLLRQKCEHSITACELLLIEGSCHEAVREADRAIQFARALGSIEHEWPSMLIKARAFQNIGMTVQSRETLKECVETIERASNDIATEEARRCYLDQPDRALAFSLYESSRLD